MEAKCSFCDNPVGEMDDGKVCEIYEHPYYHLTCRKCYEQKRFEQIEGVKQRDSHNAKGLLGFERD